ncbi:gallate dioxygenase, partial [Klebsiella pneumoniae]|nr:gallate dioxygenase [Klebsiella pneumoniae]
MANILGGIALSHTPTIRFPGAHHKQQHPAWAPILLRFEPLQRWLEEKIPDALVHIFNDHGAAFFFGHYSTFMLGMYG